MWRHTHKHPAPPLRDVNFDALDDGRDPSANGGADGTRGHVTSRKARRGLSVSPRRRRRGSPGTG